MPALYAALVSSCFILSSANIVGKEPARKPCLPAVGYYVAIKARLYNEDQIWVFGASNLPRGSLITITVYDFAGEGGKTLSQDATVAVGKDGLFEVTVHPAKGLRFRNNLICDAVFMPNFPKQTAEVLRIVGKVGEHLGDTGSNPQVESNSRTTLLFARTIVTE